MIVGIKGIVIFNLVEVDFFKLFNLVWIFCNKVNIFGGYLVKEFCLREVIVCLICINWLAVLFLGIIIFFIG